MDFNSSISTATDFIASEESFSSSPYWDVNGYAIGFGNHYWEDGSSVTFDDDPISLDRGRELLKFYVNQNAQAIAVQLDVPINSNQLAALTSLRYNCGTITTSLLSLINSGSDIDSVSDRLRQTCTTSGGVTNPVLIERRGREAELYATAPGVGTLALFGVVLGLGLIVLFMRK